MAKTAKKPQLIAPVNALDEKTAKKLFENQKIVVEHLVDFNKRVNSIKKDMRKLIIEEVEKEIGDKIDMIEAIYKRTIVIQNIWFDKGFVTREEIAEKYEEIKKKKKNG